MLWGCPKIKGGHFYTLLIYLHTIGSRLKQSTGKSIGTGWNQQLNKEDKELCMYVCRTLSGGRGHA